MRNESNTRARSASSGTNGNVVAGGLIDHVRIMLNHYIVCIFSQSCDPYGVIWCDILELPRSNESHMEAKWISSLVFLLAKVSDSHVDER